MLNQDPGVARADAPEVSHPGSAWGLRFAEGHHHDRAAEARNCAPHGLPMNAQVIRAPGPPGGRRPPAARHSETPAAAEPSSTDPELVSPSHGRGDSKPRTPPLRGHYGHGSSSASDGISADRRAVGHSNRLNFIDGELVCVPRYACVEEGGSLTPHA